VTPVSKCEEDIKVERSEVRYETGGRLFCGFATLIARNRDSISHALCRRHSATEGSHVTIPRENVSPHELKLRRKKTLAPPSEDSSTIPERQGDRGSGDDDDDDRHLSTSRLAQRYDVTTRTIERWEEDERLGFPEPDLRINKRKYWKLKTLERWERRRAAASNT
jgi:hypothetical protein